MLPPDHLAKRIVNELGPEPSTRPTLFQDIIGSISHAWKTSDHRDMTYRA
ncbi:hypothetical protein P1P68_16140 [Streptomyces scabiei]|nr:hypothetical protein [Streptomyces scabiei]MDW8806272.1 hypothetical protein [Streptomyces scabiei]